MSSGQKAILSSKINPKYKNVRSLSQYLKPKHWLGGSEYKPLFILDGPANYFKGALTILDDDQNWSLPSMSIISFYIWADNPNMEKSGNTFVIKKPLSRAGETINIQAPVFLNLWKDYLIDPIKRRFRFDWCWLNWNDTRLLIGKTGLCWTVKCLIPYHRLRVLHRSCPRPLCTRLWRARLLEMGLTPGQCWRMA